MITEDYCSYEVAKLLEEKGFDEKTLSYYYENNVLCHGDWFEWNRSPLGHIAAPTHQMAMKWLRKEKNLFIHVWYDGIDFNAECVVNIKNFTYIGNYSTYEEATEAALKYTLENLI